ncbi:hypothetical protein [Adlercreutzia sp. ZJ242]|uniref:hypothetical protein n=1 Tax=Adlercreutzia sp. ZJ242 TaxID=2709409 RepID=UPI00197CF429|nr:hypothetical protein [Adlercreutzia sp. ZJ242]
MKRITTKTLAVVASAILIAGMISGCAESEEVKEAKSACSAEIERLEGQEVELDAAIADGEELIAAGENLLEPELIPALETAVSEGKAAKIEIPSIPSKIEDIEATTNELKAVSYVEERTGIENTAEAVRRSIRQYDLVDQPTEAYVIERLGEVDGVQDISAVTEEHDPNGNLNKAGGYTAAVYFSSPLVDLSKLPGAGSSIIDRGTDGGGCVEVYSTAEDAQKREEYLAVFDGGALASGSHAVVGTTLVRTSDKLTASQQEALEKAIIDSLVFIEE